VPEVIKEPDDAGLEEWFDRAIARERGDDTCWLVADDEGQIAGFVFYENRMGHHRQAVDDGTDGPNRQTFSPARVAGVAGRWRRHLPRCGGREASS
jgi:hypothetical protein